MTKQEYATYQAAVAKSLDGQFACSGCCHQSCRDCDCDEYNFCERERWFSARACDVCGDPHGGNRYAIHAFDRAGKIVHYDACERCVYYVDFGHLDDATMASLEAA